MKATTAILLARPAAAADRGRFVLIAASTAIAGGLLLGAAHVARLTEFDEGTPDWYMSDSGIKPAMLFAIALLIVPVLALAVQSLRVGSVARDRRMAALRLAGATPRDIRLVAAAEASGAAFAGGLFAGWTYLVFWLLLGVIPPAEFRLLGTPDLLDLVFAALIAALSAAAGALAGAAVEKRVVTEPLGVYRRGRERTPGNASKRVMLAGVGLALGGLVYFRAAMNGEDLFAPLAVFMCGVIVTVFAGGPRFVRWWARRLGARGGPEHLLAGFRLEADPWSNGRVVGVLFVCGFALGFEGLFATEMFLQPYAYSLTDGFDTAAYLELMAILVTMIAAGVAILTLIVGAADQLLDARRPLATLSVLGTDELTLAHVLRRQLSAGSIVAIVGGVIAGIALLVLISLTSEDSEFDPGFIKLLVASTAGTSVIAAALVSLASRVAARMLRPRLRAAIDPGNLRVG